jgi:type VI secretion system VasD/TssJ family lipoprotein
MFMRGLAAKSGGRFVKKTFGGAGFAVFLFLSTMLAGCSPMVYVRIHSGNNLNTEDKSMPLPVVMRVYLLTGKTQFQAADFHELWHHDKKYLGTALLKRRVVVVRPNARTSVKMPYSSRARYIAGVAIFRNPGESHWRFIEPISHNIFADMWHRVFSISTSVVLTKNKLRVVN